MNYLFIVFVNNMLFGWHAFIIDSCHYFAKQFIKRSKFDCAKKCCNVAEKHIELEKLCYKRIKSAKLYAGVLTKEELNANP